MSESLLLEEKRKLTRRELIYYLRVLDNDTGVELGRLVDIHTEGMLLMGTDALEIGRGYNMALKMPKAIAETGPDSIVMKGQALWVRPGINTSFKESGIFFIDLDKTQKAMIDKLIKLFSLPDGTLSNY